MAERSSSGMSGILGVIVGAFIVIAVAYFVTDGFGMNRDEVSIELKLPNGG